MQIVPEQFDTLGAISQEAESRIAGVAQNSTHATGATIFTVLARVIVVNAKGAPWRFFCAAGLAVFYTEYGNSLLNRQSISSHATVVRFTKAACGFSKEGAALNEARSCLLLSDLTNRVLVAVILARVMRLAESTAEHNPVTEDA